MTKTLCQVAVVSMLCLLAVTTQAQAAPAKFSKSNQAKFPKACGDGLDANSACGDCAYVQGVGVTKSARCGHVCVQLPNDKTDKNVTVTAQAGVDSLNPSFQSCGSPDVAGECAIHWSRFEGDEYYPDKHQICGRFKNWSADRDVVFRIVVSEK